MTIILQNFYKSTLTRNWTAGVGNFYVTVAPTVSSGYLVVSPNNATQREIVKYSATGTGAYGAFVTISNLTDRGIGGTSAQTHTIGETIRMNITAEHWANMEAEISGIVAGAAPDADTTTKGIVEQATETEISLGTPTGSTGAVLFVSADKSCGSFHKTVSITSAQILALDATTHQIELVAAPGAGKIIVPEEVVYSFTAGATPYANGQSMTIYHDGDTNAYFAALANTAITSATSTVNTKVVLDEVITPGIDKALVFRQTSATAFITGNGTLKIFIKYKVLTL